MSTKLTLPSGTPLTSEDVTYLRQQLKAERTQVLMNSGEPLGLPRGSVRALITLFAMLGYAVAVGFSFYQGSPIPDSLTSIVITIVAFYFGNRSSSTTETHIADTDIAALRGPVAGMSASGTTVTTTKSDPY